MQRVRGIPHRFRFPWRSALDVRRDVDDELAFHLALRTEELERSGLSSQEARREALRQFGDLETTRKALTAAQRRGEKTMRIRKTVESLLSDWTCALRALRRNPGFAIASTLVLALGIGSSVIVFSMLDTLVLRPLPLREADRLFRIGTQPPPDAQWTMQWVDLPVVEQWQTDARSFDGIAGFMDRPLTWRGPDGPERIGGAAVVGNLFPLLGAGMTIGRPFSASESESAPAILSHEFWRRRFGGRPNVVGQTIELDGIGYTVVGVLPPETDVPFLGAQRLVWIPQAIPGLAPSRVGVNVVGRLRPGVARDTAAAELEAILRGSEDERGVSPRSAGVVLQSAQENRTELIGPTLIALFGGSLLLLLIACANVGTLSLTRLVERRHEMAVRSSLGATPWNLLRQITTEHILLWSIGGGLGLGLGGIGLRWVASAQPFPATQVPPSGAISIDARIALFACGITLATALLFGLPAARQSSNANPVTTLREDGATVSSARTTKTWRQLLVVGQVAVSTLLSSSACLLALTLLHLTSQPLGFRADGLLTFRVQLPQRDYADQASRRRFQHALVTSLRALPGVEAAATTSAPPLGTIGVGPIAVEALDLGARREPPWAGVQAVDRDYFAAAGVPVASGRRFDEKDRGEGYLVAVVNETFARTYFPGQDAIGRRIALTPVVDSPQSWLRIVGTVADVKHAGLDWDYLPELFVPYDQIPDGPLDGLLGADLFAVLRVPHGPAPTESALRGVVSGLDPNLPLTDIQTGNEIVAASARSARFRATIMGGVAALAVLLSGMGLFAVLRQSVAQRRKEFGIRMALGAAPAALVRAVCGSGLGLAVIGIGLGIIATFALAGYVRSLLFGVSAIDPAVLASVSAFMLLVAVAAAAVPAWRASRLSPTLALRAP